MKRLRNFLWRLFRRKLRVTKPEWKGVATCEVYFLPQKAKPRSWSQKFYDHSQFAKQHAHVKMGPVSWTKDGTPTDEVPA